MFHIVRRNDVIEEYGLATLSIRKNHFQWNTLKNGKNMYGLIFHPDYTHERNTFVGQEITILWQDKKILLKHLA